MNYQGLVDCFSAPRLQRYLEAVGGNKEKASLLYFRSNILGSSLFGLTSYFEVLLRNKINYFMSQKDPQWLIKLSEEQSVFNKRNTIHTYQSLLEVRERLLKQDRLNNDQMVDGMSLGFWVSLFLPHQHKDLVDDLITIFDVNHPTLRYVVQRNINQVRRLRNVIAHNGPIIFRQSTNEITFERIDIILTRIQELTIWLRVDPILYQNHIAIIKNQKRSILSLVN